jgi:hypothetical protein
MKGINRMSYEEQAELQPDGQWLITTYEYRLVKDSDALGGVRSERQFKGARLQRERPRWMTTPENPGRDS